MSAVEDQTPLSNAVSRGLAAADQRLERYIERLAYILTK